MITTSIILITIAAVLLTAYTVILCAQNGIPRSLSASVFFLPKKGAWLWTAVIAAVVFALAPVLIGTAQRAQFLAFFACAGLLFVAGCPLVKDKSDMAYRVHLVSAVVCAFSAMALVACNRLLLLMLWLPWVGVFVWKTKGVSTWPTQTFWAEMMCFLITFIYAYLMVV
jgi:hypothetical protein